MTLETFISALKTKEIKISLMDLNEDEIIKFYSDGYAGVESDLLARTVNKWYISSATTITVYLDNVETGETPTEP